MPALVQNNLFKKTSLQWAFSGESSLLFHCPCPSRQKQQAFPFVFLCLNLSVIFFLSISFFHSLYTHRPRIIISSSLLPRHFSTICSLQFFNNHLYSLDAFSLCTGNMLALVDDGKQPQRITLRDSLTIFINYRYLPHHINI